MRVVIAGLGQIGCGYADTPQGTPRSHLSAARAAGCEIAALVDPDPAARQRLAGEPTVAASLRDLAAGSAELIVLCGPSATREAQIQDALALAPRVLLVEKPLAADRETAQRLVQQAQAQGVALRVNYLRRFDPRHEQLRQSWPGLPRGVAIRYGGGLFNYASHAVDQLIDWFGAVSTVRALVDQREGEAPAEPRADPSVSFWCRFEAGFDAIFSGIPELPYALLEWDLIFDDRAVALRCGGAQQQVYYPREGAVYPGFTHLAEDPDARLLAPIGGLLETYQAIASHLADETPLAGCTGAQAVALIGVLEAVRSSVQSAGSLETPR